MKWKAPPRECTHQRRTQRIKHVLHALLLICAHGVLLAVRCQHLEQLVDAVGTVLSATTANIPDGRHQLVRNGREQPEQGLTMLRPPSCFCVAVSDCSTMDSSSLRQIRQHTHKHTPHSTQRQSPYCTQAAGDTGIAHLQYSLLASNAGWPRRFRKYTKMFVFSHSCRASEGCGHIADTHKHMQCVIQHDTGQSSTE